MNTPEKRYQVFISSTYEDLKEERAEVTQAILELDCIPCGMEAFPAADDTQWEWIKRMIKGCDYYIVIVGGKYGSINTETQKSYTQMEYEYAIQNKIPVLGFVVNDENKLTKDKIEIEKDRIEKLEVFKTLVKSKMCKFFTNIEDLGSKVSRGLTQAIKQYPRTGWIRADVLSNYKTNEEYNQLLLKYEKLKSLDRIEKGNSIKSLDETISVEYSLYKVNREYSWRDGDIILTDYFDVKLISYFIELGRIIFSNGYIDKADTNHILRDIIYKQISTKENFPIVSDEHDIRLKCNSKLLMIQLEALNLIRVISSSNYDFTSNGRKKYILSIAEKKE